MLKNNKLKSMFVILLLLTVSACATPSGTAGGEASENAADTTAVADSGKTSEEEVICRRERKTGSNMARTVCYTREAMEQIEAETRNDLYENQGR